MKALYYHGSPTCIDRLLQKGTCVSSSRANALIFALRRRKGDCYIYTVLVDPDVDLEPQIDPRQIVDLVLARDTPYLDRIHVTDELITECRGANASEISRLLA